MGRNVASKRVAFLWMRFYFKVYREMWFWCMDLDARDAACSWTRSRESSRVGVAARRQGRGRGRAT